MIIISSFSVAPEITIDSCRDGYAVREGRGARLICRVNANPSYSLTEWNSPTGKTLQSNETILEITNITRQQAGDYTCKAWNSKGPGSQACSVDVHCKFSTVFNVFFIRIFKLYSTRSAVGLASQLKQKVDKQHESEMPNMNPMRKLPNAAIFHWVMLGFVLGKLGL